MAFLAGPVMRTLWYSNVLSPSTQYLHSYSVTTTYRVLIIKYSHLTLCCNEVVIFRQIPRRYPSGQYKTNKALAVSHIH